MGGGGGELWHKQQMTSITSQYNEVDEVVLPVLENTKLIRSHPEMPSHTFSFMNHVLEIADKMRAKSLNCTSILLF